MISYFRAVAVDFDGTLSENARPAPHVLSALAEVRRAGSKLLLVTGRTAESLGSLFPDVQEHFDRIVLENGAVLLEQCRARALSSPVPFAVDHALQARGVPFERGAAILASRSRHEPAILDTIRELGLECQLVRNRTEIMVLPAGVSKGSGVFEALGDLGISHHNAIGIGDAENDHSLLETCELAVAVANAVPSLKAGADLVLEEPNGSGVAAFLRGVLRRGTMIPPSERWRVALGRFRGGPEATIPASRVNLLITGGSRSGKSYLAGLLAERLIDLGYSLCLLDPEGDYEPLDVLRGVLSVGGKTPLPSPLEIGRLLRHRFGSVIANTSMLPPSERRNYFRALLPILQKEREASGLPHWIFIDEAHDAFGRSEADTSPGLSALAGRGFCLVTYLPEQIQPRAWAEMDLLFVLPSQVASALGAPAPTAVLDGILDSEVSERLREAEFGDALVLPRRSPESARIFAVAPRSIGHVRHWHKYTHAQLAPSLKFYFQTDETGAAEPLVSGNIDEFHRSLSTCSGSVFRFHAARYDFSRWMREVIQDLLLADRFEEIERVLAETATDDVDVFRRQMLDSLETRYSVVPSEP